MSEIAPLLLPWFERYGRKHLPWQQRADAYRVWVSEIMLQQTQVSTVIPYFERFMHSFPSVKRLADAHLDEVLQHWAGLGYYARARNLHKTAAIVRDEYQGLFPSDLDQLVALPGIGRSTAGAIASLGFGHYAPILDGNVKRVLSRVYQVAGWPGQSATLKQLWLLAEQQTPETDSACYNQAMMDLGAMVCMRARPQCAQCPLNAICQSYCKKTIDLYPQPKPKKQRPQHHRWLLIHRHENRLLLERRPPQGIWGGLWSLPELETLDDLQSWQRDHIGDCHEVKQQQKHQLKHRFSHFDLSISIARIPVLTTCQEPASLSLKDTDTLLWIEQDRLNDFGMPAPVFKLLSQQF